MSTFFTLAVLTGLCFAFKPLRGYGVALLALLLLGYPAGGWALLVLAVITYLYLKRK